MHGRGIAGRVNILSGCGSRRTASKYGVMEVGVVSASELSSRSSSAQRRALGRPSVQPPGWKGAAWGEREDDGLGEGADGWTRKVSMPGATWAPLASACVATAAATTSGRKGGVDAAGLVVPVSSAPNGSATDSGEGCRGAPVPAPSGADWKPLLQVEAVVEEHDVVGDRDGDLELLETSMTVAVAWTDVSGSGGGAPSPNPAVVGSVAASALEPGGGGIRGGASALDLAVTRVGRGQEVDGEGVEGARRRGLPPMVWQPAVPG